LGCSIRSRLRDAGAGTAGIDGITGAATIGIAITGIVGTIGGAGIVGTGTAGTGIGGITDIIVGEVRTLPA
jgi:hypothetical protein